jgi:hypothetical protein
MNVLACNSDTETAEVMEERSRNFRRFTSKTFLLDVAKDVEWIVGRLINRGSVIE